MNEGEFVVGIRRTDRPLAAGRGGGLKGAQGGRGKRRRRATSSINGVLAQECIRCPLLVPVIVVMEWHATLEWYAIIISQYE